MKHVTAKFGTMRKAVEFTVYPRKAEDKTVRLQSGHRCVMFDVDSGNGFLSPHAANYPHFLQCNPSLGGVAITVPKDVIAAAVDATPKSGDQIGPGVYVL